MDISPSMHSATWKSVPLWWSILCVQKRILGDFFSRSRMQCSNSLQPRIQINFREGCFARDTPSFLYFRLKFSPVSKVETFKQIALCYVFHDCCNLPRNVWKILTELLLNNCWIELDRWKEILILQRTYAINIPYFLGSKLSKIKESIENLLKHIKNTIKEP